MARTSITTGYRFRLVPRIHYRQKATLEDERNILIDNILVIRWLRFAYIVEWYA